MAATVVALLPTKPRRTKFRLFDNHQVQYKISVIITAGYYPFRTCSRSYELFPFFHTNGGDESRYSPPPPLFSSLHRSPFNLLYHLSPLLTVSYSLTPHRHDRKYYIQFIKFPLRNFKGSCSFQYCCMATNQEY